MTATVAVRAEKITLCGLRPQQLSGDATVADLELLATSIPVMKLQGGARCVISAVFAAPSAVGEEFGFELGSASLLVPIGRRVPTPPTVLGEVLR